MVSDVRYRNVHSLKNPDVRNQAAGIRGRIRHILELSCLHLTEMSKQKRTVVLDCAQEGKG